MNSFPLFSFVPVNRSQKVTMCCRQKRFMMFACAFKDKELRSLKSCACPGIRDIEAMFIKGYFTMLGLVV